MEQHVVLNCEYCLKDFTRPLWRIRQVEKGMIPKMRFCTRKCKDESQKGKKISEKSKRILLQYSRNQNHSFESRLKRREKTCGKNHYNWKGGKKTLLDTLRRGFEYRLWRKQVLERDGWVCQRCGCDKKNTLQTHHIKEFSIYPELRFVASNGITLCKKCHKHTNNYAKRTDLCVY